SRRLRCAVFERGTEVRNTVLPRTVQLYVAVLFALPAVALTAATALTAAQGLSVMGLPRSDFGVRVYLLAPLVPIALALFGFGVSERRSGNAVLTMFLMAAAAVVTELAVLERAGATVSAGDVLRIVQLTALVSAGGGLLWRALIITLNRDDEALRMPMWP